MQDISPCLWFDNQGEEAAHFYTSLFKNSKVGHKTYYTPSVTGSSGKEGSVLTVYFEIQDQKIVNLNGGPYFKFTPALSYFVWCESENEVDRLWQALSAGGQVLMGLDKYPFAKKYGWTTDKYGLSWQLFHGDEARHQLAPAFLFVNKLYGRGEEAIQFYQKLFPNSKIEFMAKDDTKNVIQHAVFTLNGSRFVLMEGEGEHNHTFNEAFSLMVNCDTQEEIDRCWDYLIQDGGSPSQCGWVKDKFGVSWQIAPAELREWTKHPDRMDAVMKEVMKMKKLDLGKLKAAFEVQKR